jgi:hypothetical protein
LDDVILDEIVISFSKWDPVRFSLQWLELVEISRVLLRVLVEKMSFVEFDVIRLAEMVVSSTPERDPVQFSKQWPELFKIDLVLS